MLNSEAALDRMFRALADTTRRGMVERLTHGPASVGELARPLDMTLSGWIAERRTSWERRVDRLGEYLAEQSDGPRREE